ncbi:DUF1450 domain-containing protein [Brevibacillus massiliensis]|uniref:DUF1450 domain-containing protein n=2 Tax=Brevibacillus massiliensis TaxID=1118054 RepID=UPI0013761C5B|nr:DUF1450 domain-containing protein [Brevibacillus massiliensis]
MKQPGGMNLSNQLFYCFRNNLRKCEHEIRKAAAELHLQIDIYPAYCMKLCMLCEQRLVAIVNREVILAEDPAELIQLLREKLD